MGAWGSAAPIAARGEVEEEEAEAGGAGWVKLMVRSTGGGMEEDWAVDLAVSKLEEGEGPGGWGGGGRGWRRGRTEGRKGEGVLDGEGLEGKKKDMFQKRTKRR